MSKRSREVLPDFQEGSSGPCGGQREIGRASQRSGRDQEFLPKVWEGLVSPRYCPPGGLGGVSRPSQMSGRGR